MKARQDGFPDALARAEEVLAPRRAAVALLIPGASDASDAVPPAAMAVAFLAQTDAVFGKLAVQELACRAPAGSQSADLDAAARWVELYIPDAVRFAARSFADPVLADVEPEPAQSDSPRQVFAPGLAAPKALRGPEQK